MNSLAEDRRHESDHPVSAEHEIGFRGPIHGVSLVDLFQIFHYSRRSLVLHVESDGEVHFASGEIIHATWENETGEAALGLLFSLRGGDIRSAAARTVTPSISRPFQSLLLDCLREVDESRRGDDLVGSFDDATEKTFLSTSHLPPAGSKFPSVPPGHGLLSSACVQLRERVDQGWAALVVDLDRGVVLASATESSQMAGLNEATLAATSLELFRTNSFGVLDDLLRDERDETPTRPPCLEHLRMVGADGLCFAKRLDQKQIGVVLWAGAGASLGLAWTELRQSVAMIERILV